MQERAAESEPLRHAARVRGDALGANVPEAEALEQHADPLPPLAHAVEAAVEIEVLERGQVSVEKRLVADEAELAAGGVDLELATRRRGEAGHQAEERRLARPVCAGDNEKAAALELEVERLQRAAPPVALLERPSPNHSSTSAKTNAKKTMLITPLTVKNAASRRRRSPGRTSECS